LSRVCEEIVREMRKRGQVRIIGALFRTKGEKKLHLTYNWLGH
jgi:hypothetical protein